MKKKKKKTYKFASLILSLIVVAACALTGCSGDKDGDGVADGVDDCPTRHMGRHPDPARPGCEAKDPDRDGVLDDTDLCPGMPAGQTADPNRAGCPAPIVIPTIPEPTPDRLPPEGDYDNDGLANNVDQCPTVGKGDHPDPARTGCPAGDRDHDGVKDHDDRCPGEGSTTENDPDGDGCTNPDRDHDGVLDTDDRCPDLSSETPDAGASADGGAVGDASDVTDAGNPHPGCPAGHEPTGTDGGTDETTTDVPPGNGSTTEIVQVPPTTVTQPIPAERIVSGLAVGEILETTRRRRTAGRRRANAFCLISEEQVTELISSVANSDCRSNETGCWRRASDASVVVDCGTSPTPTPGCRYAGGRIFACVQGAESVIVWRCAEGTAPCTAQNASDAWRTRHPRS